MTELTITGDWENLNEGTVEERACFAAVDISFGDLHLTEGHDAFVNKIRQAPLLSAYHLAEWFAWNWWRLRWEPRSNSPDWVFSHCLSTIGGGYIWPNITIFSDGERVALISKPTHEHKNIPFRYINDFAAVVIASQFESTIENFLGQVLSQLRTEKVANTNLNNVWNDVLDERANKETSRRRKIEALLGCDPDKADEASIVSLLKDSIVLGEGAINEIAAEHASGGKLLTRSELDIVAARIGFDASPQNSVRLAAGSGLPRAGEVPAWRLGTRVAQILREQLALRDKPISNKALAEMASVQIDAITQHKPGANISFALDKDPRSGRVVLRSKWETGRRFELSRLLADRIVSVSNGALHPATRSYTYQQKMQRAFAAEFLSPFDAVDEMLAGDYSMESQENVAEHFSVSPMTISTLLINHHRVPREEPEVDFEQVAVA